MSDWKVTISGEADTASITDITNYVSTILLPFSAIDEFYNTRNELLATITPGFATNNPRVSALVLVGLISATENYFRNIFAEMIKICPISKKNTAEKSVNLATTWFGYKNLEKGAFENSSFSDYKVVKNNLNNIFGINIEQGANQIQAPLLQFQKLCEMRHAIVHSSGNITGKNAVKLNLPSSPNEARITVQFAELQEAADICTSLVRAANAEIYIKMSRRWMHDWPKLPTFNPANSNKLFKRLWKSLFSQIDFNTSQITNPLTETRARNLIRRTNAM